MTKDELKKEAEEYTETKGKEHFRKFYNSDKNIAELIAQVYLDCAEPREKRIAELEQKLEQMKNEKFEIALSQIKHDRQKVIEYNESLQKENAELKEKINILDNCDRLGDVITQAYKDQLTKAKKLIKQLLDFGLCDRCTERAEEEKTLITEAENFLKDSEV